MLTIDLQLADLTAVRSVTKFFCSAQENKCLIAAQLHHESDSYRHINALQHSMIIQQYITENLQEINSVTSTLPRQEFLLAHSLRHKKAYLKFCGAQQIWLTGRYESEMTKMSWEGVTMRGMRWRGSATELWKSLYFLDIHGSSSTKIGIENRKNIGKYNFKPLYNKY